MAETLKTDIGGNKVGDSSMAQIRIHTPTPVQALAVRKCEQQPAQLDFKKKERFRNRKKISFDFREIERHSEKEP